MRPTIIMTGNLTKDPILEKTKNGVPCVKFTVACNGARKEDRAVFMWCIAYNSAAENIAKFFAKGTPIQVVGELSQYEDDKRSTHTFCDVIRWGFAPNGGTRKEPPPPADQSRSTPPAQTTQQSDTQDEPDDDIPF
ncbi:MAG: single-stranded DNA-binding protein [Opitutales bacterium]|nr:single-stranded DNA-binding protein [Opitutales bacterium]